MSYKEFKAPYWRFKEAQTFLGFKFWDVPWEDKLEIVELVFGEEARDAFECPGEYDLDVVNDDTLVILTIYDDD